MADVFFNYFFILENGIFLILSSTKKTFTLLFWVNCLNLMNQTFVYFG